MMAKGGTKEVIGLMNDMILNNMELTGSSFFVHGSDIRADVQVKTVVPLDMESCGLLRRRPRIKEGGELYALLNSVPETSTEGVDVIAVLKTDDGETYGTYLGAHTLNTIAQQMQNLPLQPVPDDQELVWPTFVEGETGKIIAVAAN